MDMLDLLNNISFARDCIAELQKLGVPAPKIASDEVCDRAFQLLDEGHSAPYAASLINTAIKEGRL